MLGYLERAVIEGQAALHWLANHQDLFVGDDGMRLAGGGGTLVFATLAMIVRKL